MDINENMEILNTASNYQFSAVKLDALEATEYTLALMLVDRSSSLSGYEKDLESMLKCAIESCQKSPRAENLMARTVYFDTVEDEMHGFKLLNQIDIKEYDNTIKCKSCTSLFDATYHAIESVSNYGEILTSQDYLTNAIIFIITDGMDNQSVMTPNSIVDLIKSVKQKETLESIATVLVGMSGEQMVQQYLDNFYKEAGLTEYIDMGEVSAGKLAKLAKFISRNTSSTSQALGTGGVSQSLSF